MAELCHKPDDIWKLEHKRLNVWFHFLVNKSKKHNSSQAKCVYCGQILTIPHASLRFHLLAKNQHGGKTVDMNVNPFSEAKSNSEIKPTSVENERAFSAAGLFTTKLRTSLKPETLDTLCFLRAHLQNK